MRRIELVLFGLWSLASACRPNKNVAQAVMRILDTPSPAHRIYNVVDDEAPDLITLFASVGAPPPDGSTAEHASAFDALLDGRRIREDLGFAPKFPRLTPGA